MRLVVTGGMGFIGNGFVRLVLRERPDWSVVNLDLLTYAGNPENLSGAVDDAEGRGRYEFVHGDIADPVLVARVLAGCDVVVNFAAESHVDRSIEDAATFMRTNVVGAEVLLSAARRSGVRRFVQVSTDEVYGDLRPDAAPCDESAPLAPSSPYAASKAAADLLTLAFHRTYGLDVVVTRSTNNYGPRQFPEKLVPLMILGAFEGRRLPVYGRGENLRDWIAVEDSCRGILAALERGRPGGVYNLGTGVERPNLDVVRRIVELVGGAEDAIEFVADRPGHDRRYAVDCARARSELGWAPLVDFEEGLARTVEWYRANPDWWRRVRDGAYRESARRIASWTPSPTVNLR